MAVYVAVAVLGAVVVLAMLAGWALRGYAANWCMCCGGAVGAVCGACTHRAIREQVMCTPSPRLVRDRVDVEAVSA
ncbi:hypothetical protein ACFQZ4_22375 [Catellatospora coxensis]|uniref:Uncharacterized protein n=1 Tax=Catellatospora coxensis TaxID=310354 RepID=A0A8J3KS96_9ACTN|nr:hypothetical protein [Catellatospora coxensis]GIG05278.1 hypothetical protein Cco03nite_19780 [Catellatospora coxensis]